MQNSITVTKCFFINCDSVRSVGFNTINHEGGFGGKQASLKYSQDSFQDGNMFFSDTVLHCSLAVHRGVNDTCYVSMWSLGILDTHAWKPWVTGLKKQSRGAR